MRMSISQASAPLAAVPASAALPIAGAPLSAYLLTYGFLGLLALARSTPFRFWVTAKALRLHGATQREARNWAWREVTHPESPDPTLPRAAKNDGGAGLRVVRGSVDT